MARGLLAVWFGVALVGYGWLAIGVTSAQPTAPEPTLRLEPNYGPCGTRFVIHGAGFPPNADIETQGPLLVSARLSAAFAITQMARTDARGEFSLPAQMPCNEFNQRPFENPGAWLYWAGAVATPPVETWTPFYITEPETAPVRLPRGGEPPGSTGDRLTPLGLIALGAGLVVAGYASRSRLTQPGSRDQR